MVDSSLLLAPGFIFIGALILVVTTIIVLTVMEKKLKRKIIFTKKEEDTYFQKRFQSIEGIKKSDPSGFLNSLDELAREFFSERYGINSNEKYFNMIEKFKSENNIKAVAFSEGMQESYYSGGNLSYEKLEFLSETLGKLINEDAKNSEWAAKERKKTLIETVKNELSEKPSEQLIEPSNEKKAESFVEKMTSKIEFWKDKKETGKVVQEDSQDLEKIWEEKVRDAERRRLEKLRQDHEMQMAASMEIQEQKPINEEIPRVKPIETVPYKAVEIKPERVEQTSKEPKGYRAIGSIDDLDRVKRRIAEKRKRFSFEENSRVI